MPIRVGSKGWQIAEVVVAGVEFDSGMRHEARSQKIAAHAKAGGGHGLISSGTIELHRVVERKDTLVVKTGLEKDEWILNRPAQHADTGARCACVFEVVKAAAFEIDEASGNLLIGVVTIGGGVGS